MRNGKNKLTHDGAVIVKKKKKNKSTSFDDCPSISKDTI